MSLTIKKSEGDIIAGFKKEKLMAISFSFFPLTII